MEEEVKRWWNKAKGDLVKAKDNLKIKHYDLASFLCQQAVEKGFKALLIQRTKNFPKIHDLTKLAELNNTPLDVKEKCAKIDPAYITSRYPDLAKKYTKKGCEEVISYCNDILQWIKKNLN